jgi:glucosamine-6-phosphate deaminase
MKWQFVDDYDALSRAAASIFLSAIRSRPAIVLGLPTGATPEGMYRRVVAECTREYHCFSSATTFNLDEYVGIPREHPGSYFSYMQLRLFGHIDVDPARVHVPQGAAPDSERLERACVEYEESIRGVGGIDLMFLGMGRNGHIGFNEPGTPFPARTHVVELKESTRRANAPYFPSEEMPRRAITMGIGTILESRAIVLLASGEAKREAVRRLASGEITEQFPASALHRHGEVTVIVDRAAGE